MLDPLVLIRLVSKAREQNNHYIYMDLLKNWSPRFIIPEEEQRYIEYLITKSGDKLPDEFENFQFFGWNMNYSQAIVCWSLRMNQIRVQYDKNWKHWIIPDAMFSDFIHGPQIQCWDWLTREECPWLFTWDIIHQHVFTKLDWVLFYHILQNQFQDLPLLDNNSDCSRTQTNTTYLSKWFGITPVNTNLTFNVNQDLCKILTYCLQQRYLQFTDLNAWSGVQTELYQVCLISQAILEKRELIADYMAQALSGRLDKMQQIQQASIGGEMKTQHVSEIVYVEEFIAFDLAFARMVTGYMHGSSGYNYKSYVKNGFELFGENWKSELNTVVEHKRKRKLDEFKQSKTRQQEQLKERLNKLGVWERMLAEQRLENNGGGDHLMTQEEYDLLTKRKGDLVEITASEMQLDIDDLTTLQSLL
jgi:hypothetical protein